MWRWFWRAVGLGAFVSSTLCCMFLWRLWATAGLVPNIGGQPVGLDGLSLQLDILSLTLAAVGIALAAISFVGYQALKDAAEARAERAAAEVASAKADEVATNAVAKHIENMRREIGLQGADRPATIDPASVTVAMRKEAGGERDTRG